MLYLYRLQIVKLNNNNNHKSHSSIAYNNSNNAGSQILIYTHRYDIHTQNIYHKLGMILDVDPREAEVVSSSSTSRTSPTGRQCCFSIGGGRISRFPHREIQHMGKSFLAGGSMLGLVGNI